MICPVESPYYVHHGCSYQKTNHSFHLDAFTVSKFKGLCYIPKRGGGAFVSLKIKQSIRKEVELQLGFEIDEDGEREKCR